MRAVKFLVVLAAMLVVIGCASSRALERGAQGAALGAGIGHLAGNGGAAGGLIGGAVGSIVGTVESDKNMAVGASGPLQRSQHYHPSLFYLKGKRVIVRANGRSENSSVLGIVVDYLRWQGAEVVALRLSGHWQEVEAPFSLEIDARNEGRAVVELWLIERATGAILAYGVGSSEYYYDGSDRWRPYQWAAKRAIQRLQ